MPNGVVQVWTIQLDTSPDDATPLSADELARALRFFFPADRRRFIAARAALRTIIGAECSLSPSELVFAYGANGKPTTRGRVKFNLAHSGELALLALTAEREVGVDIEQLQPITNMELLVERFFTPAERTLIGNDSTVFLRHWTRKEAILKLTGQGLSRPLNTIDVAWPGPNSPLMTVDDATGATWRATVQDLAPPPGYAAALAVAGAAPWRVEWRAYAAKEA